MERVIIVTHFSGNLYEVEVGLQVFPVLWSVIKYMRQSGRKLFRLRNYFTYFYIQTAKVQIWRSVRGSSRIVIIFTRVRGWGRGSVVDVVLFMMHCDFHLGSLQIDISK